MNMPFKGMALIFLMSISYIVQANADPTTDDVHCFIVYLSMLNSQDPAMRGAGTAGQLYWMGKLDGRSPELNLENRIIEELPKMTGDLFRTEAIRCGAELVKRGQAETAMGKDLQQHGAKMLQDENTH